MKDTPQVCLELLVRSVALEINQKHPASVTITVFLPPATKFGQGYIFTGVCDFVHRGGVWSRGVVSNFSGGVSPIFWGGLQFWGGSPKFFFFLFFQIFIPPKFLLGCTNPPPPPPPETVNARAVCILLECILVFSCKNGGLVQ